VIGQESEPERLDPLTIKSPETFRVSWQIYEGLLGLSDGGEALPMLAERWETRDSQSWTFHLRRNAFFHSSELFGSEDRSRQVTARDVLTSYTSYCAPAAYPSFLLTDSIKGCADYNAGKAKAVEGLKVLDDFTFRIILNKPEPFFLNRITTAWVAIFPSEAGLPQFKDRWGLELAVGTGPYRLHSKSDSEIVLRKNENYWDHARVPKIHQLVYRVIKNDQVRLSELVNQKLDMMVVPTALFPTIFEREGQLRGPYKDRFRQLVLKTFNTHMIGVNLKKVPDVHLRRAMFYGTDRKGMIQSLLYGYAEPTGGTVPPDLNGYKPAMGGAIYDLQRAKKELHQSQYKGEELELLVHELANSEAIGQTFQSQMKAIGINIRLTKLDFNSVIGRFLKGDAALFSMYFEYVFSSPELILINLFSTNKIPVPNFWQYSNPLVDEQLESLRKQKLNKISVERSAEIEERIMQDVPAIFLYRQKYIVLYSNRFDNLHVNGHGHYQFGELRVTQ
jgi:ABC-type transport system substrate-binding protein